MTTGPVAPPTVRDYLRILYRRWWVVVLGVAALPLIIRRDVS